MTNFRDNLESHQGILEVIFWIAYNYVVPSLTSKISRAQFTFDC